MVDPVLRDQLVAIICEGMQESSGGKLLEAAKQVMPVLAWVMPLRPDFVAPASALIAAIAEADRQFGHGEARQ